MKSKDIFVLNANNGILLVNSKNAEMLAVKTEYINDVIKNIEEKNNNKSLKKFFEELSEKNFIEAKIEDGNGIGIIPTLGCNFSCTYCFQKKLKKVDILPDMIPNIKKFIYEWNEKMHCKTSLDNIGIMGGEILRNEMRNINYRILKEFGFVNYSITTNGVGILDYKEFFIKYRPRTTISIDGTQKMHESKRRTNIKNSYEKIVSGIIFLIENNIEINLAVVFNPEFEIKEYILFMDWLESIGWLHNEKISVTMGIEMDEGVRGAKIEKWEQSLIRFEQLLRADYRAKYFIRDLLPGAKNLERVMINKRLTGNVDKFYCSANLLDNLIFAPDGFVYNCNLTLNKNKIGKYFPNIEIYYDVVERYNSRNTEQILNCKDCNMKLFCKAGCPISAMSVSNDLSTGYCGIWKEQKLLNYIDLSVDVDKLYGMAQKYEK